MRLNPLIMQGIYLTRDSNGNFVKDHYFRFNFGGKKNSTKSLATKYKLSVGDIVMNGNKKYEILFIKSESKLINDYLIQDYTED